MALPEINQTVSTNAGRTLQGVPEGSGIIETGCSMYPWAPVTAIFTFDPSSIEGLAKVGIHVCYCNGGRPPQDAASRRRSSLTLRAGAAKRSSRLLRKRPGGLKRPRAGMEINPLKYRDLA